MNETTNQAPSHSESTGEVVPRVGQTWKFSDTEQTLTGIVGEFAPGKYRFKTRIGRSDEEGYLSVSLYNGTATIISSPTDREERGRFPPQAGDVWRLERTGLVNGEVGAELVFTGKRCSCHHPRPGDEVWHTDHGQICGSRFTDGTLTFVRHGTSPVPKEAERVDKPAPRCQHGSFAEFCPPCLDKQPTPAPSKPVRTPDTYESLMRKAREADGLPGEAPKCGYCFEAKPLGYDGRCARCHINYDYYNVTAKMFERGQRATKPAPEPWVPSCDIDADIPSPTEFGSKCP